jgi:cell division cycle protein 37
VQHKLPPVVGSHVITLLHSIRFSRLRALDSVIRSHSHLGSDAQSMSRLNYNKWDNLQLSDDSDIEVHPNVDKKSMIRWKQRDIHEKREQRKLKLEQFKREVPMNESLLDRIRQLEQGTTEGGAAYVQSEVDRLKNSLGYDYAQKQFSQGEQPSEDHMIVSLLSQVISAVQKQEVEQGKQDDKEGRPQRLLEQLAWHRKRLEDRQVEIEKEKEEIDRESKKYITSEDIRTGWDSKTVRLSLSFRAGPP